MTDNIIPFPDLKYDFPEGALVTEPANSGGSGPPSTSDRLARLEGWSGQVNLRLQSMDGKMDRMDGKIDRILEMQGGLPTKTDMRGYLLTGLGIVIASIALFIAGMDWLDSRRSPPPAAVAAAPIQPIIIQVPAAK
jgi:hypothetical protein